jgi:methyl-accepting chemotaxis protein
MKIIHKMFVSPLIAILILCIMGVIAWLSLSASEQRLHLLTNTTFVNFETSSEQAILLGEVHASIYAKMVIIASLDESAVKKFTTETNQRLDDAVRFFEEMKAKAQDKSQAAELGAKITTILGRYKKSFNDAIDLASMDANTGAAAMQSTHAEFMSLRKELDAYLAQVHTESVQISDENRKQYQRTIWLISLSIIVAFILMCVSSYVMARKITIPLKRSIDFAQSVASGHLGRSMEFDSNDEIGTLMQALKEMSDSLLKVVTEVRLGADHIAHASDEIAQGNLDLSQRTELQVHALQDTSGAMSNLTHIVQDNVEYVQQVNNMAQQASGTAQRGGQVVKQVIESMSFIDQSSKKIAEIISVIDGIAFQTNILALNAAVEAARAGEQGRGFAVVASEVRNLAQRTTAAAKEISSLIHDSVDQVNHGSQLVDQAGVTMQDIVNHIQSLSTMLAEISSSSRDQNERIHDANSAVEQMGETTQQNAVLVEQASASTTSLNEAANQLVQVISHFQLELDDVQTRQSIGKRYEPRLIQQIESNQG